MVLSCMPALMKITSVWQTGEMKVAEVLGVGRETSFAVEKLMVILQCMDACQEKCTEIHSVVAQALLENAKI